MGGRTRQVAVERGDGVMGYKQIQFCLGWSLKYSSAFLSVILVCASLFALPRVIQAQETLRGGGSAPMSAQDDFAPDATLPPLPRRGWEFSLIGRTDATYTDNAYLTTINRKSDYILSPAAILDVRETGPRSALNAKIEIAHDFYANASNLNGPRIKALTDGTVGTSDDTFSIRGRVATNLQASSQLGILPATERSVGGNQVQVLTYGIAPTVRQPLSAAILSEATYDVSGVTFIRAPTGSTRVAASDSVQQKAQARLSNDIQSALIGWHLTGSYEHRNLESIAPSSQRANSEAGGEYRLTNTFALLARGGYEWVDEPTFTDSLSGAYGLAGFAFRPNSRTSLRVEAGYRYRKPNFSGELKYSRSQRLVVAASFDRGVETPQSILNNTFAGIGRDPLGNLVDPLTGLAADPRGSAFDLNNQAFRFSRVRFGIQGTLRRSFYSLSSDYERRSVNAAKGESWGGQVVLGRDLTRRMSATIEGRYVKTTRPILVVNSGLNSETTAGTARLTYRISETLNGSLRYAHLKQSTSLVNYRENAVILSFSKTF